MLTAPLAETPHDEWQHRFFRMAAWRVATINQRCEEGKKHVTDKSNAVPRGSESISSAWSRKISCFILS